MNLSRTIGLSVLLTILLCVVAITLSFALAHGPIFLMMLIAPGYLVAGLLGAVPEVLFKIIFFLVQFFYSFALIKLAQWLFSLAKADHTR